MCLQAGRKFVSSQNPSREFDSRIVGIQHVVTPYGTYLFVFGKVIDQVVVNLTPS
jgi:hypothetical protein